MFLCGFSHSNPDTHTHLHPYIHTHLYIELISLCLFCSRPISPEDDSSYSSRSKLYPVIRGVEVTCQSKPGEMDGDDYDFAFQGQVVSD